MWSASAIRRGGWKGCKHCIHRISLFEGPPMTRFTRWLLAGSTVLALAVPALAQDPKPFEPAPKGFDVRRDNIERGKIETVEYDSKAVGGKRKLVVYTPPGYAAANKYPVLYLLHGGG